MEENNKTWLEQFKANYNGTSDESKELAEFIKSTYNGATYIPWATMERLTYMQDANAKFNTILNNDNSIVWTDSFLNSNKSVAKDGSVVETQALVVSHFVKVSCEFLGKLFVEEYPIQDQDYSAAKIYNQNLVNKALKRAMAKVASRATGLGLKLYEDKDLQFDDNVSNEKPEIKKTTKSKKVEEVEQVVEEKVQQEVVGQKVENTTVESTTVENNVSFSKDIDELIALIKNTDREKMTKVLQNLNVAVLKQHGFTLGIDDSYLDLGNKLQAFKDVTVFTKAIKNMIG